MSTAETKKAADRGKAEGAPAKPDAMKSGAADKPGTGRSAVPAASALNTAKARKQPAAESPVIPGAAGLRSRVVARLMVLLVLLIGVFALIERGGAVEWLFAAAAVLIAVCGLLLPYAAVGRIQAERTVYEADELVDGGDMRVKLSLRLNRMLPFMWVCLQEEIDNASGPQDSGVKVVRALLPGFSRRLILTYTVSGLQRGELTFRRVTLSAGDMLGLTARTVTVDCPGRAVVKPAPPAGEQLGALPGFEPAQVRQGMQPVSVFGGQMMSAASRLRRDGAGPELRAYMPGDSLRRVDWRAMARGLGMQTRMNEAEEAGTVIVLLEVSAPAYGKDRRLFDANAGRAMAIMRQAEREGKRVKVLTNSIAESVIHEGGGGSAAMREAETRLAKLRLGEAVKPMSQRLSDIVAGAPRGASVICLTAGKTVSAEMIARQSGDPGNVSYGAKLAGVRGIRLLLLLSVPAFGDGNAEKSWQERLQGTGCSVKAMPVPESYGSVKPDMAEAAARSGRERGGVHVEAANS